MADTRRTPLIIAGLWLVTTLFWWGLAFFPVAHSSPDWLVAARDVCFGTLENGLPGPAGWMVLVLGPLSFLLAFLIAWPGGLRQGLESVCKSGGGRAVLVLAFAMVLIETGWVARKVEMGLRISRFDFSRQKEEALPDSYPRAHRPAADFTLTDQSGKTLQLSSLRGETVVLTFAFAHCQTVCPVLVKQSLEVLTNLKNRRLRVLIVTLDPWRDTPKALPFLAERWGLPASAHVLSGPVKDVVAVLELFKVPFKRNEKTGAVDHPALTYVISPKGELAYTFNNAPSDWLIQAVDRIENEKDIATARQGI